MTTPGRAGAALTLAATLAAAALTGCAGAAADPTSIRRTDQVSEGSSTSRHLYTSLHEMVETADLVLTGTAGAQQVVTDIPGSTLPFTLTDLSVDQVLHSDGPTTAAGSTVVVRQTTTPTGSTSSEPDAIVEPGQRYLLFLVHSQLPGQAATHHYPVGVVAGIYRGDDGAFTRAVPDSGDDVPTTLTPEQLRD